MNQDFSGILSLSFELVFVTEGFCACVSALRASRPVPYMVLLGSKYAANMSRERGVYLGKGVFGYFWVLGVGAFVVFS
jgi:hypothetical protein